MNTVDFVKEIDVLDRLNATVCEIIDGLEDERLDTVARLVAEVDETLRTHPATMSLRYLWAVSKEQIKGNAGKSMDRLWDASKDSINGSWDDWQEAKETLHCIAIGLRCASWGIAHVADIAEGRNK